MPAQDDRQLTVWSPFEVRMLNRKEGEPMCDSKQIKRWMGYLATLLAVLSIFVLVTVCSLNDAHAYSASQRRSLESGHVMISRERFLKSAAAHVKRANQVGYGYNRMLNGTTYYPLAQSAQKFCCVDLVTHVVYTATASKLNGVYKTIDQTLATQHTYNASNGIVFDTQTVSVLGSQIREMASVYQSLGGNVNPTSLKLGDIVLTGDKNGSVLSHAVLVIGKVSVGENAWMQIPNHNPDTIYFISMSSTSLASYRGVSWLNRAWYHDDPNKGYFIKQVYRPLPKLRQTDAGAFRFKKTDATNGAGLAGAEFKLTRPDGSDYQIVMTSGTYTSAKTYLPGVYTLTETKAPPGYSADATPKTFTIESDEMNSVYWDAPIGNTPSSGLVRVIKKDAVTGSAVSGAVFELSQDASFPQQKSIRLTTGANGVTVPSSFLINNGARVYVREISVPAPYLLDTNVKSLKLIQGGTASVEFFNNHAQGKIEVIKKDSISKTPIEGVTFEIRDANEKTVDVIISGHDGKAISKQLPPGSYTVRETIRPDGYQVNRKIYTADLNYVDMVTPLPGVTIEVNNDPVRGKIRIIKHVKDETLPVEGAVFELLDANGAPATDLYGTRVPHLTSDTQGFALTPDLRYGTYIVREIEAPDGYYLNEKTYEVAVVDNAQTVDLAIHNEQVQFKLRVKKVDSETDLPLAGAEFQVFDESGALVQLRKSEGGQARRSDRLVTDENGEAISDEPLGVGRYRLVEVKAPDGYHSSIDRTFEIRRDTTYVTLQLSGRVIDEQVSNAPTAVLISKRTISGDHELPGASLRLVESTSNTIVAEWISGTEPHLVKRLKVGRIYVLRETLAPLGYAMSEDVEFTVADTAEVQRVVMRDLLTQVKILKKDAKTDNPLAGARFEIEDHEGNEVLFVYDKETGIY
ncbi:MAG TPA: SpaA isopeptide-forming pilin-related protein, partial [Clostridia bacterium]|nr:SpaA isopeptide-forming pilin-related protein [Clostridia bacterium]